MEEQYVAGKKAGELPRTGTTSSLYPECRGSKEKCLKKCLKKAKQVKQMGGWAGFGVKDHVQSKGGTHCSALADCCYMGT